MTTRQLSTALERHGRPIPASGITRMEKGERQVTADDLVALAVIFGVSPAALLLPLTDDPTVSVEVTGGGAVDSMDAWRWANGQRPLKLSPGREQTEMLEHQLYGMPQWLRLMSPQDAAMVGARMREAGVPWDELLRKAGLTDG